MEKGMATHSSILARGIPWTEEPGGLQSMGYQRVRHDWAPQHSTEGLEADVLFFVVVSEQMLLCLPLCCFVAAAPQTPRLLVSCPGSLASASLPFTIPSWPCGGADVIILCGSGHPCFGPPILTLWLSKRVLFRPACGYFPLLFLSFFFFFNFTILYWFCHISKWICHRYTCVPHYRPSTPVTSWVYSGTCITFHVVWANILGRVTGTCPPSDPRQLRFCCMEVPGLKMLKPRSSYPLLAGHWPYVRGLESKQFHCSIIKLESRALEIAPSFLCPNPVKGILFLAVWTAASLCCFFISYSS